jgi:PAS domain-containing protein
LPLRQIFGIDFEPKLWRTAWFARWRTELDASSFYIEHEPNPINLATTMTDLLQKLDNVQRLRTQAEARLNLSEAANSRGYSAPSALGLIHQLASSPTTAPDALVLLHELQVHQVEIDLQAEELRLALAEQEAALARQLRIHDAIPAACLTIDSDTRIQDVNAAGAKLFGMDKNALLKQVLNAFLTPQSRHDLGVLLRSVDRDMQAGARKLTLLTDTAPARSVLASASAAPDAGRYIIACMVDAASPALL